MGRAPGGSGISIINTAQNKTRQLVPGTKVSSLIRVADSSIWAATSIGLVHFNLDGKQLARYTENDGPIQYHSLSMDEQSGILYMGSWDKGLVTFNTSTQKFESINLQNPENEEDGNNAYYLYSDNDRKIWIGTWGSMVKCFDPNTNKVISYGFPTSRLQGGAEVYKDIISVYKDEKGILWLGSNGGGLCKIDESFDQFNISNKANLPDEPIWALFNDSSAAHLWVGVKGNNNLYHSTDKVNYSAIQVPTQAKYLKEGIRAIYKDNREQLWAADNSSLFQIRSMGNGYEVVPVELI